MSKENKFWSTVGKIAVVIGLIVGLFELYHYVFNTEFNISAEGEHFEYRTPDSFVGDIRNLNSFISLDSTLNIVEKDLEIKDDQFDKAMYLKEKLGSKLGSVSPINLERLSSMWHFHIKNEGDNAVNNLNLETPFDGFFFVKLPGYSEREGKFRETINIGTLRPSNIAEVYLWTNYDPSPLDLYYDDIKVTSALGVTKPSYPEKVRGIPAFFVRNWYWITMGLLIIVFIVSQIYLNEEEEEDPEEAEQENS